MKISGERKCGREDAEDRFTCVKTLIRGKKIIIIISQEDLGRFPGCGYPVRRFKSSEIEIRNILLFAERIRIIQLHKVI